MSTSTAIEAYDVARPGDAVIGWKLDRSQRDALLKRFPPTYARTIADHVTLRSGVAGDSPLPHAVPALIVGRTDDGQGIETMVVEVDGTTERPDGGTYHITWSIADGRTAKESDNAIREEGWDALPEPVPVRLEPASFR